MREKESYPTLLPPQTDPSEDIYEKRKNNIMDDDLSYYSRQVPRIREPYGSVKVDCTGDMRIMPGLLRL